MGKPFYLINLIGGHIAFNQKKRNFSHIKFYLKTFIGFHEIHNFLYRVAFNGYLQSLFNVKMGF